MILNAIKVKTVNSTSFMGKQLTIIEYGRKAYSLAPNNAVSCFFAILSKT